MLSARQYDLSYTALFQFISKNKVLDEKINSIDSRSEKITALLKSIVDGNFEHEIYNDADCDVYLLSLYKNNLISGSVFISLYNYLMALMEFGDQPLKKEDHKYKFQIQNKPTLEPLFIDGKLNSIFRFHFDSIQSYLKMRHGKEIDINSVLNFCKSLSKAESSFICITTNAHEENVLTKLNASKVDIYSFKINSVRRQTGDVTIFYQMNFALAEYLSGLIKGTPMRLLPGFGRVGDETLRDLHLHNAHFCPLYNKHVKSNLVSAHSGLIQGPFSMIAHDLFHGYVASLYSESDRKFIFGYLIDVLSNQNIINKEQLKSLLYGDTSLNDLNPLAIGYTNTFYDLNPDGPDRLLYFVSNVILKFCFSKLLKSEQNGTSRVVSKNIAEYQIGLDFIKLLVDISQSFDTKRREVFKHTVEYIEYRANTLPYFSPDEKKEIIDYCRGGNKQIGISKLFYHHATSAKTSEDARNTLALNSL